MSYVEVDAGAVQTRVLPALRTAKRTSLMPCLVVSANKTRRELLAESAAAAGWTVVACSQAPRALAEANRRRFRMAIVDLEGCPPGTSSRLRELCTRLPALCDGLLLTVCGHEGDPQEEIWARQLGAWVYLPGLDVEADLTPLWTEAIAAADHAVAVP